MESKNMKLIGSGSGSQIYLYSSKAGNFALKFVPAQNKKELAHLNNQAKVLSALDHDYIIKSLKYQQNLNFHGKKQNSQLRNVGNILVLQYASKGTLLDYFKSTKLTQQEIKILFKKICIGLKNIHMKGYSHRDLKLQNILIFQENQKILPKLSDFGFASYCFKEGEMLKFKQFRGTKKGYMAPQIHHAYQTKDFSYDAMKCDIFALGVIMFALVLGRLPFEYSTKDNKIYKFIAEQKYDQFWQYHKSQIQSRKLYQDQDSLEKFKDLFVRMVHNNPQQRPSISQILQNSWFN